MVSGFFTSPKDQERMSCGEASPILMESKSSVCDCDFNNPRRSFIAFLRPALNLLAFPSLVQASIVEVQLDVDPQRADLLHQHVEGLWHACFHALVAIDDVLVHLG